MTLTLQVSDTISWLESLCLYTPLPQKCSREMTNTYLFLHPIPSKDVRILHHQSYNSIWAFNFFHQKYVWQTTSQFKCLRQRLKNLALRIS